MTREASPPRPVVEDERFFSDLSEHDGGPRVPNFEDPAKDHDEGEQDDESMPVEPDVEREPDDEEDLPLPADKQE